MGDVSDIKLIRTEQIYFVHCEMPCIYN